jgi:hypothetical protein
MWGIERWLWFFLFYKIFDYGPCFIIYAMSFIFEEEGLIKSVFSFSVIHSPSHPVSPVSRSMLEGLKESLMGSVRMETGHCFQ